MPHSALWLPHVLQNAGLKVATVPGWEERGIGDVGPILGVICHHTVGPRSGNMPSLDTLIKGRPATPTKSALPGPLSQLGLGRDGTYYVVAAGRCNHAGDGAWRGLVNGNTNFIGIEAENTGGANDLPWPDIQMDAYRHGVGAILRHVGRDAGFCVGHREWALPPGRKPDPTFDMSGFRASVAAILAGTVATLVPIPAAEPPPSPGAAPGRPTLRRGAVGDHVKAVQSAVGVMANGSFDAMTEAAVRSFQRDHNLVPDGIVGPKTWAMLDAEAGG